MKKMLATLAAVAVMGMASIASATTWSQTINTDVAISNSNWFGYDYHYYHDLTGVGFTPGSDIISSYDLIIGLKDDGDRKSETAWILQLGSIFDDDTATKYDFSASFAEIGVTIAGLIDLNHDGTLNVWIDSTQGDFIFDYSTLNAYGCGTSAPVPEPSTMLMLGAGLLGLGLYGRRRVQK